MKRYIPLFSLLALIAPFSWSQTDLVFPWVTNQTQFRSQIAINNLNATSVTVTLTATRPSGSVPDQDTVQVMLNPVEQVVMSAADLFPDLGDGSGFMVRLTSADDNITGAFVVSGTGSPSGSSPAQANVFAAAEANPLILFNFLNISAEGFSAPVVINMGTTATVTFHAYQDGNEVATVERLIEGGRPLAELAQTLFAGVSGNLFVVAESAQPLLGVAFIFNLDREPSMANAVPIDALPDLNTGTPVSFAAQIQPIFSNSCGNGACHLQGQNSSGLQLDPGLAYGNTVNVNAIQNGSLPRINPGNPEDSYLYRKLLNFNEAVYFGARMPSGRAPLPAEQLELLRTWIAEGAQNN